MSKKTDLQSTNLSTEHVDNITGEIIAVPRYSPPRLNKAGMEVPSAITLCAVPALRDFDLGVRIRRFMSAPQSVQERYDNYDPDDTDFDNVVLTDDENPMTPHELRAEEVRTFMRDREKERIKQRDDEKAKKLADETARFKELYKSLREQGAIPPAENTSNEA